MVVVGRKWRVEEFEDDGLLYSGAGAKLLNSQAWASHSVPAAGHPRRVRIHLVRRLEAD